VVPLASYFKLSRFAYSRSLVRCGGLRALVDVVLMDQLRNGADEVDSFDNLAKPASKKSRKQANAERTERAAVQVDESDEDEGPPPTAHALVVRMLRE
jgi:hypothetical protein